jgi:hypothetical protein
VVLVSAKDQKGTNTILQITGTPSSKESDFSVFSSANFIVMYINKDSGNADNSFHNAFGKRSYIVAYEKENESRACLYLILVQREDGRYHLLNRIEGDAVSKSMPEFIIPVSNEIVK